MAYLEVRRGDELIKRRQIDGALAERGYPVRLGQEKAILTLGQTKQIGPYTVTLNPGVVPSDHDQFHPAIQISETETSGYKSNPDQIAPDTQRPDIPGYEITGRIGAGGMGSVWLATQLSTNRKVALKMMSRSFFGSEKAQNRFTREVELTARLDYPNIAKVYDSGLKEGGYFYVMEYIEGYPLDIYVEGNTLLQKQILKLMAKICKAVHHAHLKGIIHRDLKPSNILMTGDGEPHIVDFGLAKSFLEEDSNVQVSIDGEIAGTPAYMSPEQARGDLRQIDMRTDVYSLGIILFRLLTKEHPHELSGTRLEILQRIAEKEVKRPRQVKKDIDSELESLLLKALARDPDGRYLSAGDMADDIDNYLNGEPLSARSATTIYFLRKKVRKHLPKVCAGVAVIVIVLGVCLFAFLQVIASRARIRAAQEELEIQRKSAELAQSEVSSIKDKWRDLELMVLEGRNDTDVRAAIRTLREEYLAAQKEIEALKEEIAMQKNPITYWQPKRAAPPPAVKVNGRPFFVICARASEPNDFKDIAQARYNTVSYTYRNGAQEYLDAAEKYALKAIVYTGGGIRETVDWDECGKDIEKLKDHVAILSWGLPVCPIYHKRSVNEIITAYNTVQQADLNQPAFLLFTPTKRAWPSVTEFAMHTDVIAIEPHVYSNIVVNGLELRDRILGVPYWMDEALKVADGRPVWNHIQAYLSNQKFTPKQFRASAYLAVNHGTTGIFVCGYKKRLFLEDLPEGSEGVIGLGDPQMSDIRVEAARLAGELKQLSPAFLRGHLLNEISISNGDGVIDYKAYASPQNDTLYIVAINTSNQNVSPVFYIPQGMMNQVDVLGESRFLNQSDGVLIDTFNPYDTHIYILKVRYPERIVYVNQYAPGNNNGVTWQDAYTDLQDALENAIPGSNIWVAAGTYTPDRGLGNRKKSFILKNNVKLYGGFFGTEITLDQRNPDKNKTILSGDLNGDDGPDFTNNIENSYRVISASGTTATAVLDGFTITGGNANGPQEPNFLWNRGAGMYASLGRATITNCTFIRNWADGGGAGIYTLYYSNLTIINCVFIYNSAENGGAMRIRNSSSTLISCTFKNNTARDRGGAVFNSSDVNPMYINCMFIDNSASNKGGGMYNRDGINNNPMLINCTFTKNSAGDGGGAMHNHRNSSPTLINCILWGDIPDEISVKDGTPIITYSNIQGGWPGEGNISVDPMFVNPDRDDYNLKSESARWDTNSQSWVQDDFTSPCIDAGSMEYAIDSKDIDGDGDCEECIPFDISGNPRVQGKSIDIGAYESQPMQ